jgi:hypothetical protein
MTDEERVRMKWLCLLIHEENDENLFKQLVKELEELLAAPRYIPGPAPQARPN